MGLAGSGFSRGRGDIRHPLLGDPATGREVGLGTQPRVGSNRMISDYHRDGNYQQAADYLVADGPGPDGRQMSLRWAEAAWLQPRQERHQAQAIVLAAALSRRMLPPEGPRGSGAQLLAGRLAGRS